ncbi:zinc ribbon domain-containing protein [Candidatus Micrarchaeota archaeon]|nr:zinc ribbon domain-containing protein [Candidatus Micrarchaeota archaeon]
MGLFDVIKRAFKKNPYAGVKKECPNCGAEITLDMERCPKCGVRISSMFKKKCPKCKALNDLTAVVCEKCGYSFARELERAAKRVYKCPICGYKSEAYLTKCPACGTRFG